jgi:formate dehydrogenase major subunit
LLHSLAHVLVTEGLVRNEYVDARCDGFLDYAAFLQDYAPEATETITGVPAESVRRAARLYGTAANPMQAHGLGMTEHYQGSESVMLLCNLALLVGAVGREGVGVNPLRGQNNVQGAADMGCAPDLLPGYQPVADAAVRARVGEVWGAVPPDRPGRTIPGIYDAIRAGEIRGLFILGEDVVQTDPATHVGDALDRLELLVVQELFLTRTAERATVVLPGAGFLEKDGSFTNGERRIQRVRKAVEPPAGAQEDWRTLLELMAATDCPQPFDGPAAIMDEIARVVPAFRGVSYARLDADGLQWPVPSPEHPGTSRLHTETFPVGKARFATVPFLPSPSEEVDTDTWPLRLVTGRRLEHYNCGSMTRRSENAAIAPEDEVVIHPEDAVRAGVRDGDRAMVESPWGVARARARVSDEVAEGTCFLTFHFPETGTNDVISPVLDRLADCPEYKLTPVRVRPE